MSFEILIAIASFVVPIVSGLVVWFFKLLFDEIKKIREEAARTARAQDIRMDMLEDALHTHKLYAANTFVKNLEMQSLEKKIIEHLTRIEDKLDKKADKS